MNYLLKSILLIAAICLMLFSFNCSGGHLAKGDAAYDQLKYKDAIKYYEKALSNSDNHQAKLKLANSYRLTNLYEDAERWYAEVVQHSAVEPEAKFFYAQMLLANEKPELALKWAKIYQLQMPNDGRAQNLIESIEQQDSEGISQSEYSIQKAMFNADASDFSPMYFDRGLVFISDRGNAKNPWTGRAYTAIYETDESGSFTRPLTGNFSGAFNDGPLTFSKDFRSMYFTRNNPKKKKGENDVIQVSIFKASRMGDDWDLSEAFPHNSEDFSNMHPALSKDGRMMIFASDRPGGIGNKDLYLSIYENGRWSLPQNLGVPVNTSGNEAFPYLDDEGTLYFSSDGLPGKGGLDIFYTQLENGYWTTPRNLAAPINSTKDDFGLITKDNLRSGYFSSNRNTANGTDDIYSFTKIAKEVALNGIVLDEETKIPLPDVEVTIINESNGIKEVTKTSTDGRFNFILAPATSFRISGLKNDIVTEIVTVSTKNKVDERPITVKLLHNDPRFTLNGKAINKNNDLGVQGVEVKLFNLRTSKEETTFTDKDGAFSFQLEQNTDYQISGLKDGYFTSVQEATTNGLNRSTTLYVKLFLMIEEVIIGKEIKLDNASFAGEDFKDILYDFNKWDIRRDAAKELDKLVRILQRNASITIELGAHTDARGESRYNQYLSRKRAKAAVAYIISKGIQPYRLTAQGYGETKPLNHCRDGVQCSEAEHQVNRRTEIRIIELR